MPTPRQQDKMLSVLQDGMIDTPQDIPDYYATTREAIAAGRTYLLNHPTAAGFLVRRIFNVGHYRTLHSEGRHQETTPT